MWRLEWKTPCTRALHCTTPILVKVIDEKYLVYRETLTWVLDFGLYQPPYNILWVEEEGNLSYDIYTSASMNSNAKLSLQLGAELTY